jgi:hypothetical protein
MKKIILALTFITIATTLNAQDKEMRSSKPLQLSFGINAGYPVGQFRALTFLAFGGDLQLAYNVSSNFSLTASGGFDVWIGRGVNPSRNYAPVLGGLKFFFSDKLFISEQAGYSIGVSEGIESAFTNVAGIGFKLSRSSDILLNYKGLYYSGDKGTELSSIGVRIAYNFGK